MLLVGGLVTWQLKYLTYISFEDQQGQMDLCCLPKLLPEGILLLWLLLFEQAVEFRLNRNGKTQAWDLCEGWTPQQRFLGVLGAVSGAR